MGPELTRLAAVQGGIFHRYQALDCGYSEDEVATHLRAKVWVRVRRGAYVSAELWRRLDAAGRHVLLVHAVAGNLSGRVVVTGYSALALMNVPLWGVDLALVHVHREAGKSGRREAGVVHHVGALVEDDVVELGGLLVARPARCLADSLRSASGEAAVVLADGARRVLGLDLDEAKRAVQAQSDWAGSMRAMRALLFSDPRAATVGESRGRVMMARLGLPKPELQQRIISADGRLLAISDYYFLDFDTAAEFDGKVKYGRELYERTGRIEDADVGSVVWAEKRREDSVRDEGNEMVRFVWCELDGRDREMERRFRRAFDRVTRRRPAQ